MLLPWSKGVAIFAPLSLFFPLYIYIPLSILLYYCAPWGNHATNKDPRRSNKRERERESGCGVGKMALWSPASWRKEVFFNSLSLVKRNQVVEIPIMSLVGHIPFYFPSKTSFFLIKLSVERIVLWVLSSPPPPYARSLVFFRESLLSSVFLLNHSQVASTIDGHRRLDRPMKSRFCLYFDSYWTFHVTYCFFSV